MSLESCNAAPLEWLWRQGCKAKLNSRKTCIAGERTILLSALSLVNHETVFIHTHIYFFPIPFFGASPCVILYRNPPAAMWFGLSIASPPAYVPVTWLKSGVQEWVFNQIWATSTAPLPDLRNKNVFFLCKGSAALQLQTATLLPTAWQIHLETQEKQAEMLRSFLTSFEPLF